MQKTSGRPGQVVLTHVMSLINYLYKTAWFLPVRIVLSYLYGSLVYLRNKFYDLNIFKTYRVKTPVISVGNISVGGSGKTILVQALINQFLRLNKKPSILSRGYGRSSRGLLVVADENGVKASLSESGDEPFFLAGNFGGVPIVVSEDRVKGAKFLEKSFTPDVIILDDGFQHRRLHRDLDILIIDFNISQRPRLLPRGFLRENTASIQRADVVVFSKDGLQDNASQNLLFEYENQVRGKDNIRRSLDDLRGDYGLFAGLGNSDFFFNEIEAFHGPAKARIAFPDHAQYDAGQLVEIARHSCDYWLTTQKDFIKLDATFCKTHRVYFVAVKAALPLVLLDHLKRHFKYISHPK